MRRVLCLHMPYLATDRTRLRGLAHGRSPGRTDGPSDCDSQGELFALREPPLVLTRRCGARTVVEHACPRAERLGIRPGMTLGQARALAPQLLALEHEQRADHRVLNELADWAIRFSPLVQPVPPDTLLLDITGCAHRLRPSGSAAPPDQADPGEIHLARQALGGLMRMGFQARAAVADTVGAAWALAHSGGQPLAIVPPGQTSAYLAPLPPEALRIEATVVEHLAALGVRTIGDLLMLPRADLATRFGPQLVQRLREALGEVCEPLAAHESHVPPAARMRFETPLRELSIVTRALLDLLDEVLARAEQRELSVRRLDLVLTWESPRCEPSRIRIRLTRPSRRGEHLRELLAQRLQRVDLAPGLCGIMLVASDAVRCPTDQPELFDAPPPQTSADLAGLVDHLAGRLGSQAVVRPRLVDDHQPELAFRYVPALDGLDIRREPAPAVHGEPEGRRPVAARESGSPRGGVDIPSLTLVPRLPRPIRLLPRPVPIRVISVVPDGPPAWMLYQGREHRVHRASGPERIETGWWRGLDIRRDYWRIETDDGTWFWIFYCFRSRAWHLHGIFA